MSDRIVEYKELKASSIGKVPKLGAFLFIRSCDDCHFYLVDGILHRTDGPAVIHKGGSQYYIQNGEFHNLNGPAIVRDNESLFFLFGNHVTKKQWLKEREKLLVEEQKQNIKNEIV